ncbi:MAG TPA: IclR family transcriptional regulator [Rariglobus sp.]|jgi:IclR family acetate operon transcriptional repressor|nr:IclR family transcriptional regulator [Rariglobus sp.]
MSAIIPNLAKACQVLRALTEHTDGATLVDISETLKIPKTTAFRILNTFCEAGLVTKTDTVYLAGPELARVGLLTLNRMDIRELARPLLTQLATDTGETAHLAVLSGDKSLILDVCDSPHPIRAASRPGTLADLHASSTGKVLMAHLDEETRSMLFSSLNLTARTPQTLSDASRLQHECDRVRTQGYAIDDEEYHLGVRCLAAAVRNERGRVVAAIGITGTAIRFGKSRDAEIARCVTAAATELSRSMGYFVRAA